MSKTRKNGEGSIRKRPDGRYEFRIKGKSYYFKTQGEAVREGRKIASKAEICNMENTNIKFDALAKEWVEGKRKATKKSTWQTYEYGLEKLTPSIGKKKVAALRAADFQKVLDNMGSVYSKCYISKVKEVAYGIMELAERNDIIVKNPVKYCSVPNIAKEASDKEAFTTEEIMQINERILEHPHGDILYIMINTGIRGQELCALDKDSLIEKSGRPYLRIKQAMTREGGTWKVSSTKSKKGNRLIPLTDEIVRVIKKRIIASPSNYLFTNQNGDVINYTTLRNIYKKSLQYIGVRYLPPHSCRHTYATELSKKGVSPLIIQYLLGHEDYETTANVYTHLKEDDLWAAVAK